MLRIIQLIDDHIEPQNRTKQSRDLASLISILQKKRRAVEIFLDDKLFTKTFQKYRWSGKLVLDFLTNGDVLSLGMVNKQMLKWTREVVAWKRVYEIAIYDTKPCIIYHSHCESQEDHILDFDKLTDKQRGWTTPLVHKLCCITEIGALFDPGTIAGIRPSKGEFCFKSLEHIPDEILSHLEKVHICFDPEESIKGVTLPKCETLRLSTECYTENADITFDIDWNCFPNIKFLLLEPLLWVNPEHHFRFDSLPSNVHITIFPIVDDYRQLNEETRCHIYLPNLEDVKCLEFRSDFGEHNKDKFSLIYDPPIHTLKDSDPIMQNIQKMTNERIKKLSLDDVLPYTWPVI